MAIGKNRAIWKQCVYIPNLKNRGHTEYLSKPSAASNIELFNNITLSQSQSRTTVTLVYFFHVDFEEKVSSLRRWASCSRQTSRQSLVVAH